MENITYKKMGLEKFGMKLSNNFLKAPRGEEFIHSEDIEETCRMLLFKPRFVTGGILVIKEDGTVLFIVKRGSKCMPSFEFPAEEDYNVLAKCEFSVDFLIHMVLDKRPGSIVNMKHCGILVEIAKDTYKVIEE